MLLLEKLTLLEEDYDYLAKGIIVGAGIGILIGFIINDTILAFSTCTFIGMTFSLGCSVYKKIKHK
ncbi:hypothetical protein R0131_17760 [Clostridium sp. AL.422]|uniref:hypothetical protein n=1 Tax=Clostridium TaxID=1485 RepID=UPI00293DC25E|nr:MULTISPECIES: hypothetical protein [unclassified Clostridium]MDV4152678.1 hypothetical protein [Clostridium sp. AL.422]